MPELDHPTTSFDDVWARVDDLVAKAGTPRRLRVESADSSVEIEWNVEAAAVASGPPTLAAAESAEVGDTAAPGAGAATTIDAPSVGTFYRAPDPNADPFVEVGDLVEAGQQVAIVEAMKFMIPVESPVAGRIEEILIDNGATVEFGTPMIRLLAAGSHG
ncbi:acetyl-CoA carboxylase biotin carboxyl carrier protein subunit [Enemella evansiae]|uniref:acetyl-CoA carboxylase biotin carboxyl carrier protein n=1 Tax=Enemella evansiae TaxID=2016499 RepID=UPI000B97AA19|nr:acetyl-CoA carboxylase biotin carboxyl carrier protein subunit [Enemella evansiae]OYO15514.1 acetyl-CoA carboxylase biotin carboxyl carrier protein subunit [Enemella evansiae]